MEAKELMIDDIVNYDDGHGVVNKAFRVCGITETEVLLADGRWYVKVYIKPIPLTPEILEKLGFSVFHESDYRSVYRKWFPGYICVEYKISKVDKDRNCLKIFTEEGLVVNIHILNFHQFQQALRLCGLREFADNLMI